MLLDTSRCARFSDMDEQAISDDDRAVQDDETVEVPCSLLQGTLILKAELFILIVNAWGKTPQ
jgi:hypothetical protein